MLWIRVAAELRRWSCRERIIALTPGAAVVAEAPTCIWRKSPPFRQLATHRNQGRVNPPASGFAELQNYGAANAMDLRVEVAFDASGL